jgi:hypothetical protein
VPREADVPPGLMQLDRLQINNGAITRWLPPRIAAIDAAGERAER